MAVSCRLCLSTKHVDLMYRQGIYRCLECGCLFRGEITFDYSWYSRVDYWYKGVEELQLYQKSMFAWFEDLILPGTSIEYGAADGDFLVLVRKAIPCNYPVYYNELTDMLRPEYADLKIQKEIGSFEEHKPGAESCANIFMIDVLEHINDPLGATRCVARGLRPGGRFFVVTNNADALNAHNEIFYHQEHLCLFGSNAFGYLAERSGLRILRYVNSPQGLSFVVFEKPEQKDELVLF